MGNSDKIAPFDRNAHFVMKDWYVILSPSSWCIKISNSYDAVSSYRLMVEVTYCSFQTVEFAL